MGKAALIEEQALEEWPTPRRWTREEYHRMAEAGAIGRDERVELIQGEVVQMAPQGPHHSTGTRRLQEILRDAFGSGFDVRPQLPLALGAHSEPEPDVAVVRGTYQEYEDAHPTTAVLVVEVADTTLPFDRGRKAGMYAAAGIADYWIINLEDDLIEVHRSPQPDSASPTGASYGEVIRHRRGAIVTPLEAPHAQIRVDDLLPPAKTT